MGTALEPRTKRREHRSLVARLSIVVLVLAVSCAAFALLPLLPGAWTKRPKCAHAKEVAAAKKQVALSKCYVNARAKGHPFDPVCMTRVTEKYLVSLDKVDNSPWCAPYYPQEKCTPPDNGFDGCGE